MRALAVAVALLALASPGETQTVHVRKSIGSLAAPEIAALRKGITPMKSRSASDPTSWSYQANVHGTVDNPTRAAWSSCQHGSFYFLSWPHARVRCTKPST